MILVLETEPGPGQMLPIPNLEHEPGNRDPQMAVSFVLLACVWSIFTGKLMKLKFQGPALSKAPLYAESSLKCSRLRGEVRLQSEHSFVSFSDKFA